MHHDIVIAVCLDAPSPDQRIRLFLRVEPYQQVGVDERRSHGRALGAAYSPTALLAE